MDVASWSAVVSECCSLEKWSSRVKLQPNWVRPPQVSVSLCEQSAGSRQQAFGRQSQKSAVTQKWGGKSLGEKFSVLEKHFCGSTNRRTKDYIYIDLFWIAPSH